MPPREKSPRDFLREQADITGYYQMPGSRFSGRPETKQEESFILDYMLRTGIAPTPDVVSAWKGSATPEERAMWEYAPESVMGRMGFENYAQYVKAQQYGQDYGPLAGERVPLGGLVVTDEQGNPLFRTYDPKIADTYIKRGQFITPRQLPDMGFEVPGGFQDVFNLGGIGMAPSEQERYYRGVPEPYKPPTMEEALGQLPEAEVYQARITEYTNLLADYLEEQMRTGNLSEAEAVRYAEDAASLLNAGLATTGEITLKPSYEEGFIGPQEAPVTYTVENLPFYNELWGKGGPSTLGLYQQYADRMRGQAQGQMPPIYTKPAVTGGAMGNEMAEFDAFVNELGLAPPYQNWMYQNYNDFYRQWQNSGMFVPFVEWLTQYLGGQ